MDELSRVSASRHLLRGIHAPRSGLSDSPAAGVVRKTRVSHDTRARPLPGRRAGSKRAPPHAPRSPGGSVSIQFHRTPLVGKGRNGLGAEGPASLVREPALSEKAPSGRRSVAIVASREPKRIGCLRAKWPEIGIPMGPSRDKRRRAVRTARIEERSCGVPASTAMRQRKDHSTATRESCWLSSPRRRQLDGGPAG